MSNIRDSFDAFLPDAAQIERIAAGIEAKESRRYPAVPLRRTAVILAAAMLLAVLSLSAAAYGNPSLGEKVRRFFSREEELIDAHAVMIGADDVEDGVSLRVEKAVRDGATTYLYCIITPAEGTVSGDLFTAEQFTILHTLDDFDLRGNPVRRTYPVANRQMGIPGIYAGDVLQILPKGELAEIQLILPLKLGGQTSGEYSLTLREPFTSVIQPDGTITRETLAEELSVTFSLGNITEELDVYEVYPLTEIPLGGGTVRLKSVRITPLEVRVVIDDPEEETVPVPGHPDLQVAVTEFLNSFASLHEWEDEGWTKLGSREEYVELNRNHSWGIRCYIRTASGITSLRSEGAAGYRNFRTYTPIYPEDVYKITLHGPHDEEIVIWSGNGAGRFLSKSDPHGTPLFHTK